MIHRGSQTPINTAQNGISNRLRTQRNENHQKKRRNQSNFNEFLDPDSELFRGDINHLNLGLRDE